MDIDSPDLAEKWARLRVRFGAAEIDTWRRRLPGLVASLESAYPLTGVGSPIAQGNTSLILRCRFDGVAAMLKLAYDPKLAGAEARALLAWQPSRNVPGLLAWDEAAGAVILEALPNEEPVAQSSTPATTNEVAALIRSLREASSQHALVGFESLTDRVDFVFDHWIERGSRHSPRCRELVPALRRGHEYARSLSRAPVTPVLVHGDLHPGNVLRQEDRLIAIDPRPCVGDGNFDAIDWVFFAGEEPSEWREAARGLAKQLGTSDARLWSWCRSLAVLLAMVAAYYEEPEDKVSMLLSAST